MPPGLLRWTQILILTLLAYYRLPWFRLLQTCCSELPCQLLRSLLWDLQSCTAQPSYDGQNMNICPDRWLSSLTDEVYTSLYDSMMAYDDISKRPVSAMGTEQLILWHLQFCKQQKKSAWKTRQCFYTAKNICKISNGCFVLVIEGWTMNAFTCGRSNKSFHLSAHSLLGEPESPCQRRSIQSHKQKRRRKRETSGWQRSPGPPLEIIYVSHAARMMSLQLWDKSR